MKDEIKLRALEYSDLDLINEIRNDDQNYEFTGGNKYYISKEYDKKWIENKIFQNQNQVYLTILFNNNPIGYLGVIDIDYRNRKVKWAGINIHKSYTGKGYGTIAANLLLKFVFEELNMNKFYGYWLEDNLASIKMAEKIGFKKEGFEKDYVFKCNKYHNVYMMSIFYDDYIENLNNQ